jgi:hypothetical protein
MSKPRRQVRRFYALAAPIAIAGSLMVATPVAEATTSRRLTPTTSGRGTPGSCSIAGCSAGVGGGSGGGTPGSCTFTFVPTFKATCTPGVGGH